MQITDRSLALFLSLANDAAEWGGNPLINGTKEEAGNLIQLKRAGLLSTFTSDGSTFVQFTEAGKALAAEHGVRYFGGKPAVLPLRALKFGELLTLRMAAKGKIANRAVADRLVSWGLLSDGLEVTEEGRRYLA